LNDVTKEVKDFGWVLRISCILGLVTIVSSGRELPSIGCSSLYNLTNYL